MPSSWPSSRASWDFPLPPHHLSSNWHDIVDERHRRHDRLRHRLLPAQRGQDLPAHQRPTTDEVLSLLSQVSVD